MKLIASIENSSVVKDRSKAKETKCALRKINSCGFCLSLSGCADIYSVYSIFSNICQKVNILPYKMLDPVEDVITIFWKMMKALDHWYCTEKCLWPSYYADLLKIEIQKTVGSEVKYTNIGTLRETRLHSADARLFVADGIAMSFTKIFQVRFLMATQKNLWIVVE